MCLKGARFILLSDRQRGKKVQTVTEGWGLSFYIQVHFDRKGTIAGAEIKTYLLEKARVIHQTPGERNYHIFYQVCAASQQQKMLQELGVATADVFNYSKTCLVANGHDDVKNFDRTKQALHFIGFDAQSQTSIFAAVSAVLHIGNLDIRENGEGNATMDNEKHLQAVASLMKVEPGGIIKAMTERMITAGTDVMMKPESAEKANQCRDALSKALYSKLFDYIVKCVNTALRLKGQTVTMQVSVLDIFGFEVFQTNHFEQFCINFANEKLQLHFNHFNFMLERELYAREGIELVESDFVDNAACVNLIEGKGWGIQACLDDVCIMPKGDDQTFLQKLIQTPQIKGSVHFGSPKQNVNCFVINHYAGAVQYTITDFCEKNKDILAQDLVILLQGSKSKFFQALFEDAPAPANSKIGAKRSGGVAHASVSAIFKKDLQSLMDSINMADPHFVRCVNPNAEKKAYFFQEQKAVEQLRCGGVIEAVRMARESYPTRLEHKEFVGTFSVVCPGLQRGPDDRQTAMAILQAQQIPEKQFRLGKTMVLLKRDAVDKMEKERARLLSGRAIVVQSAARRLLAKIELSKKRDARAKYQSVVKLQSICRRGITRSKYSRMVQAVRMQERKRQDEESAKKAAAAKAAAESAAAAATNQPAPQVQKAPVAVAQRASAVAANSRAAVLEGLEDDDSEGEEAQKETEIEGYLEDDDPQQAQSQSMAIQAGQNRSQALTTPEDVPPVSPLCIRIQVHAEGITEALLFHVDLLASAIRQAVIIKDHKSFLKVHPNTFRGQAAIEWLRGHAARALFGSEAEKEKNQQLSRSVALLLGQKLLAGRIFSSVALLSHLLDELLFNHKSDL